MRISLIIGRRLGGGYMILVSYTCWNQDNPSIAPETHLCWAEMPRPEVLNWTTDFCNSGEEWTK